MTLRTAAKAAQCAAFLALAACASGTPEAPAARADTNGLSQTSSDIPTAGTKPPELALQVVDDRCWAREVIPAAYQHVMGEVQVVQAEVADDGTVTRPPVYRRGPVPKLVRPRSEMRFEAPCPHQMEADFAASVQRALAVRGYFAGNVTGVFDAPTAAAIRKYQSERGLESGQISLETARALGLVAIERSAADSL